MLRPGGVCAVNVPSWLGKRALEYSAFKLGLSPAEEMDDHKMYYDPRDLWPLMVRAGFCPHAIRCFRHKFGLNTFAVCRPSTTRRPRMTFTKDFLAETVAVVEALDTDQIEALADGLAAVRERGGRLFILGVGGSAGHASHAVNDFRKICDIEAYSPTDNVSELTARANDEGWDTTFAAWLRGSRLDAERRAAGLLRRRRQRREERLDQHRRRARARQGARGARSSASSAATAATPPQLADACVDRAAAVRPTTSRRTPRGCARWSGTCSSATRRWPRDGDQAGSPSYDGWPRSRLLRRICVVGGAGFIGSHFVEPAARRPGDRAGHGLRQLLLGPATGTCERSRTTRG